MVKRYEYEIVFEKDKCYFDRIGLFFSGCSDEMPDEEGYHGKCRYGDLVFQYDSEMDGVYFGGVAAGKKIDDEVFFIPEKIYGLDVVGISNASYGYLNSKTIVVPKSVVKDICNLSDTYYKNLETLVILADKLNTIGEYYGSWTKKLNTIILCVTTPPESIYGLFNNGRIFYVPDDSLYSYQTTYQNNALNFLPISEYSGDLSYLNVNKPNFNYEIDSDSSAWYYYDVSTGSSIVLTNGVFHSEIYPISASDENLYFNFIYNPNTIICGLEISSKTTNL